VKFTIKIDESTLRSKIERLVYKQIRKGCRAGMSTVMAAGESKALELVPRDTGNLAHSIGFRVEGEGWSVVGILYATASYARYVHDGTGIYGPKKTTVTYYRRPAAMHVVKLRYWKTKTRKQTRLVWTASGSKFVMTVQKYKVQKRKKVIVGSRSGGGSAIECWLVGMKARPFFKNAIEALLSRLPDLFFQGFFRAIDAAAKGKRG
jgi:hypothetical protein